MCRYDDESECLSRFRSAVRIYRFRGADINNILNFERDFPGAHIIKLEQNYRSTGNILDAATGVVSRNIARKGKRLFTDAGVAWSQGQHPRVKFETKTSDRVPSVSSGVGARLLLSYIPLEFYWAKPYQRPKSGWVFGFNIIPGW